jgi:hypothetical protein
MASSDHKVVGLFDLLGFSNRVTREGLPGLLAAYNKLLALVRRREGGGMLNCRIPAGDGAFAAAYGIFDLEHAYFSDTIVLWCTYNTFCFPPFCDVCNEFICEVLESGLPIRAGIAVGELHMDKATGTYLGKALVEAAVVEKAQEWIGASFGPSFAVAPYNSFFMASSVLVYRDHVKDRRFDLVPGLVLDWPRTWRGTRRASIQCHLSAMNTDPKFASYYQNTMKFADLSESNSGWQAAGSIHT